MAALLAAPIAGAGLVASGSPAQAAGCSETRAGAAELAESGDFTEPATVSLGRGDVTLRYSAAAGCAWGLLSGLTPGWDFRGDVWLDRSSDGGANWEQSAIRKVAPNNHHSTYTTAWSTSGFNAVRACGEVSSLKFKQQTKKNVDLKKDRIFGHSFTGIHCTEWVSV
uniref:hypothetical protein n=1 Tax=Paractinoplanes polyasparticus TaxID=2856853 RepID=UPI001C8487B9|nr:hypothetical protein [Actinoplanes polyasparticus]